ncbi:hypothetical protein LOK49_LG07G00800 [Camellia lanceoleosa]|uniref:Uncharacterized protein n=1 Tax=Camellia lanceoleosa TaxID=1840588 RepID=A0ACC0HA20_9ERIC|nr:hypothetical protein LOK49_LG07G00800 [Camellia lanceoleosa]
MDKNLGYKLLMEKIKALWKPTGTLHGLDLGNHFYLIKSQLDVDISKILNGGLWFIGPHYLAVRRWEPEFQATTASNTTTVVWARLIGLPIEFFDSSILRKIGARLGKLLKIDIFIENCARGRFARLCIQIDLSKPLISKVRVGNITQRVAYEGLPAICFNCRIVGHHLDDCKVSSKASSTTEKPIPPSPRLSEFGPWMFVEHKKTSKSVKSGAGRAAMACTSLHRNPKVWRRKTPDSNLAPKPLPQIHATASHAIQGFRRLQVKHFYF